MFRIGYGIDYHQLQTGHQFWLGGIQIPHHKGAVGHSDADVLIHAICDAMLGAVAAGDIGTHFPDTDMAYKNIDSKILLKKCNEIILEKGYHIGNIDSTICLELPKIKPHIPQMQNALAECLSISPEYISIKATTTEKLGFVGREEGVVAHATVLLMKK
ncbi:MAG: 2-C-methyl-D-erythritol 2,4-cyclodiphosphate synthase [Chitinophagaceae bacterium]|nr:2-C-methyl-D-erythritol 2,4-cyclodiphosphate synthase [Chitinophagaceae bacterium]HMN32017.1 2-C-methyl-D-erythritol 2,4-cyclodiphosphate synthase [Chitinophagaceae bacterium]